MNKIPLTRNKEMRKKAIPQKKPIPAPTPA
jgi:hypothetical protein